MGDEKIQELLLQLVQDMSFVKAYIYAILRGPNTGPLFILIKDVIR